MARRILITGGTGFLGRGLAHALKGSHKVFLAARNNKQNFAAGQSTGCEVLPMDVTSIESVRDAVVEVKPDIIIHAAATKFVDLSEKQPMECVDVNVLGSQNVLRVAVDRNVESLIGISTDKAAPPIRNIYGMSKATMERMFCSMDSKANTKITCVRYGNVAWSTGSVLPIWKKMHQDTGVIGTTGPDMTRFFFPISEAVALVLEAMNGIDRYRGKVLSREMKAAKIRDLLDAWIESRGGKWEQIEGRPGDRLFEALIGEAELAYTEELESAGVKHYLISFNNKVKNPINTILTSDNARKLTKTELLQLISMEPKE
jgi:UDP-N-acetylglucosamine 4,6-dehydratase/5-epimerase